MFLVPQNRFESVPPPCGGANRLVSIFDRAFGEDGLSGQAWGGVPVAMWEDDDHVYIEAELPGLTDKDVQITVQGGMLSIRGERKPENRRRYLYDGRAYGRFERVITLPGAVDTGDVQATMTDGVLCITFPKSPESKPRKIAIKMG